jgi:hypothetical protein
MLSPPAGRFNSINREVEDHLFPKEWAKTAGGKEKGEGLLRPSPPLPSVPPSSLLLFNTLLHLCLAGNTTCH